MPRFALVSPELAVVNVVAAEVGWQPGGGLYAVRSDTAKVGDVYDPANNRFSPPAGELEAARERAVAEIQRQRDAILAAGVPYKGKHIEVDERGRADLSGMALTAALVALGSLPEWPESYALGWITRNNTRLALPTPADGLALATAVAGWYGGLVQAARDAKDAAILSDDPTIVAAGVDWSSWAVETAPVAES